MEPLNEQPWSAAKLLSADREGLSDRRPTPPAEPATRGAERRFYCPNKLTENSTVRKKTSYGPSDLTD